MKILIVSFCFPPYNVIGSVRVGKTAKFLRAQGHEIRVIAAKDCPWPSTLGVEVPESEVTYASWVNIGLDVDLTKKQSMGAKVVGMKPGFAKNALVKMARAYKNVANIPDGNIGWIPEAVRAGAAVIADWRPDVIFASAMPISSLLAAKKLSDRFGIPWVAELRDLWTDNHYLKYPWYRRAIERRMEQKVLSSCAGLVTISQPLAEVLDRKFEPEVAVVLNGYDEEDFAAGNPPPLGLPVRIAYTGNVYQGRRDPGPLFEALSKDKSLADHTKLDFYGSDYAGLLQLVEKYKIHDCVETHDPVPYRESLAIQQRADVLLLLLYNHPMERGVLTGKLFEYIGAGRPVLCIGGGNSEAARLIRERNLGLVSDDPVEIAKQLKIWVSKKQTTGSIEPIPMEARKGLARVDQVRGFADFLSSVIQKSEGAKP